MLNDSIRYHNDTLHIDAVPVTDIIQQIGTPVYLYSLPRALHNLQRIRDAFGHLDAHIHYSAKANANLAILRTLIEAGAGIDAVSGGEIYRALKAGAQADDIVFAGVGKSPDELRYAVEQGVGWFNIENVAECDMLNQIAAERNISPARVALRLNPKVAANTHPYIATGHGGAKFGLTAAIISEILSQQEQYPYLRFEGIHVHIGSQLHDTEATTRALKIALDLIAPYPNMRTVNIGGGLPVAYTEDDPLPNVAAFAETLTPLLKDYTVLLEPGRSVIADAGILVTTILYVKQQQAGQTFYITDASMTELIRPALYQAKHTIIPIIRRGDSASRPTSVPATIAGPVCETADVLGQARLPNTLQPGDHLAILTTGAYGAVMASNYNARPRPAEAAVNPDGESWQIIRQRETWDDLLRGER